MVKKELVIVVNYAEERALTFEELCDACDISIEFIKDLIEYDIIRPRKKKSEQCLFDIAQLQRIKTVLRLQRDLEINLAGAALILDLLDEMDRLRAKVELMDKHFLR